MVFLIRQSFIYVESKKQTPVYYFLSLNANSTSFCVAFNIVKKLSQLIRPELVYRVGCLSFTITGFVQNFLLPMRTLMPTNNKCLYCHNHNITSISWKLFVSVSQILSMNFFKNISLIDKHREINLTLIYRFYL